MRRKYYIVSSLIAVLGIATMANAAQSKQTVDCGKSIASASDKFYNKVYKSVRTCLRATEKCEGDQACVGKLLVAGRGKCTVGKLDEGIEYFGQIGSDNASENSVSKIGKGIYKFVEALGKKCFLPEVDLGTGPDGLGYDPTPIDKIELATQLNPENTSGIACGAHNDLLTEMPNRDDLANQLLAHPDGSNLAIGIAFLAFPTNCK